jgi:hypothetical protein
MYVCMYVCIYVRTYITDNISSCSKDYQSWLYVVIQKAGWYMTQVATKEIEEYDEKGTTQF